mgnify:CR=1 FL=1
MRALVTLGLIVLGGGALACPGDARLFMRCETAPRGALLELCRDATHLHYRFGPKGAPPELVLSRPLGAGAEMVPWNGIGRSIWEAARLRNGDVVYEVYAGIDRFDAVDPEKPDSRFGGVVVLQDGEGEIAHLKCRAGRVEYQY